MATLNFWFDYASTYSYLSAMRIDALAGKSGVSVHWRPFLLGPIFASQGWDNSPFNIYPVKGKYMIRDMERLAQDQGLPPLNMSDVFPQNSMLAARIGMVGTREGWGPDYTRAAYTEQFANAGRIDEPETLARILSALGQDPDAVREKALSEENKLALRRQTEAAVEAGVFGAPSFTTDDGELFWGDDRLEQAIRWASEQGQETQ